MLCHQPPWLSHLAGLVKATQKEQRKKKLLQSPLKMPEPLEGIQQKGKSALKGVYLYLSVFIQVHRALNRLQINTIGQILNKPQGTNKNEEA
jgi:hypothetical protein